MKKNKNKNKKIRVDVYTVLYALIKFLEVVVASKVPQLWLAMTTGLAMMGIATNLCHGDEVDMEVVRYMQNVAFAYCFIFRQSFVTTTCVYSMAD